MRFVCNKCGKIIDEQEVIIFFKQHDSRIDAVNFTFCSEDCLKSYESKWLGVKIYDFQEGN